jgi:hypothetical protein
MSEARSDLAFVERQPTAPAVTPPPPATLLGAIIAAAKDPAVDVAKLRALLEMQERLEERDARREFTVAFTRLSAKLPRVKKNGTISLGKDKAGVEREVAFAKWEDMDRVIRPLYTAEGFSLSFNSQPRPGEGGGLIVTGTLMHEQGHSREASMPLPLDSGPDRNNLQAAGSTLSYGKRYCAEMLLNIVREGQDDDAAASSFITGDQKAELIALMHPDDTAPFLEFMGVSAIDHIAASKFDIAKRALEKKAAKRAKAHA